MTSFGGPHDAKQTPTCSSSPFLTINGLQILAAPDSTKEAFGLAGKCALDFRYLTADGKEADSVIEGRTDAQR